MYYVFLSVLRTYFVVAPNLGTEPTARKHEDDATSMHSKYRCVELFIVASANFFNPTAACTKRPFRKPY